MTATDAPRRGIPMGSIDEDSIHALVHGFYGKVMADPDLAAIFGREIEKHEWPAHLVPVNILELWQSLIDKYQDCGDEELDATLKAIIYEP